MRKEKQICDFGRKDFNLIKRTNYEKASRPTGGGSQKGKPSRGDTTPPGISSISVNSVTDTSAAISWITNEETSCIVEYGLTTSYGSTIASTGSTTHSVVVTGLLANTLYNFRIKATDLAKNITYSANNTFTTTVVPSKLIYLEFYGTTVSNTLWNVNGPIVASHSGLTDDEVASVMIRIKGHYDPFNVIITNDINLYNSTPIDKKTWVIFTESNEWYGNGAGGVAYLNSFGWADQSPAWVFTKLLNYNAHDIGEAGSHECGHTVGCRHQVTCQDGIITSQYNWGDGIVAPIMGASYGVESGDWWIGPCPLGCSSIQDDTAIITGKLGAK